MLRVGRARHTLARGTYSGSIAPVIPPLPTTNLQIRLLADTGVVTSGATVTAWNDQSGNGNNATTIVGSPQLTTDYRGLPVIRFNPDTSDSIANTTPNMDIRNASVFLIGSFVQNNASYNLLTFNNYAGTNGILRNTSTPPSHFAVGVNTTLKSRMNPYLLGFRSGASANIAYTDFETVTALAAVTADTSVDGVRVGTFVGDIYEVLVYNTTSPDIAGIRAYALAKYPMLRSTAYTLNLVYEGDSISQGTGTTRTQPWCAMVRRTSRESWRMANMGISGSQISTMTARSATTDSFIIGGARNVLNILIGRNDAGVGGLTAAQIYSALITYVQARVAAGYEVWVCTTIATSSVIDTVLTDFNALIKGTSGGGTGNGIVIDAGANRVIDFRQIPELATPTAAGNATYYQGDSTHPTPAGALLMADYFNAQIS